MLAWNYYFLQQSQRSSNAYCVHNKAALKVWSIFTLLLRLHAFLIVSTRTGKRGILKSDEIVRFHIMQCNTA